MKEISAGGLVYRKGEDDSIQIQLIQDRYGKIALPKGKMESGETIEQTALREIAEETGITGVIRAPLQTIRYRYTSPKSRKIDKEVHYFLVEAVEGELHAQVEEIRGVEWLEPLEAWRNQKQNGYENNDEVVKKGLTVLGFKVV